MKEVLYTVAENILLAPGVFRMRISGDTSAITLPGQFLELKLPGFYLRRPISVCDWDGYRFRVISGSHILHLPVKSVIVGIKIHYIFDISFKSFHCLFLPFFILWLYYKAG